MNTLKIPLLAGGEVAHPRHCVVAESIKEALTIDDWDFFEVAIQRFVISRPRKHFEWSLFIWLNGFWDSFEYGGATEKRIRYPDTECDPEWRGLGNHTLVRCGISDALSRDIWKWDSNPRFVFRAEALILESGLLDYDQLSLVGQLNLF